MKNQLVSNMITDELKQILPWSLVIDGIVLIVAVFVYDSVFAVFTGLVLGTVVMTLNMIALGITCEKAVERRVGPAKRLMFLSYVIRMAVIGCVFYIAVKTEYINAFAVIVPLFYPKLIYTLKGFIKLKGG